MVLLVYGISMPSYEQVLLSYIRTARLWENQMRFELLSANPAD